MLFLASLRDIHVDLFRGRFLYPEPDAPLFSGTGPIAKDQPIGHNGPIVIFRSELDAGVAKGVF